MRLDPNLVRLKPRERYLLMSGLAALKYKLPDNWPASLLAGQGLPRKEGPQMQPHRNSRTTIKCSTDPSLLPASAAWLEQGSKSRSTSAPKHSMLYADSAPQPPTRALLREGSETSVIHFRPQMLVDVRSQPQIFTSLERHTSKLLHSGGALPNSFQHPCSHPWSTRVVCKPKAGEYSSMLTSMAALNLTLNQAQLEEVAKTTQVI
jgi:hypothetical protein